MYHRHEARHLSNSPPVGLLVDDIDVFDFASGEHTATITVTDILGSSDSESVTFTTPGEYNNKHLMTLFAVCCNFNKPTFQVVEMLQHCRHIELNEVVKKHVVIVCTSWATNFVLILHLDFEKPADSEGRAPVPSLGICI